jgi:hypothetical protein
MPAQRDPLVQLGEIRIEEKLAQLRLPDEHDPQQLLRLGFQVEQQSDLFEEIDRKSLRFVENEHANPSGTILLVEVGLQRVQQVSGAVRRCG